MRFIRVVLVLCSLLATLAYAETTAKDAIAIVQKAAAFMKANGKEKLIQAVNAKDPAFSQGELYVAVRDQKGINLAHGANPTLVGKDLVDVPDANGKLFRREILELAKIKGKGWVDYVYRNPANGKMEHKTTYIMSVGDVTLEAGIYKP
jgi:cytochrome c